MADETGMCSYNRPKFFTQSLRFSCKFFIDQQLLTNYHIHEWLFRLGSF